MNTRRKHGARPSPTIVPVPKHGAHEPKRNTPSEEDVRKKPIDPEDPASDAPVAPDEEPWQHEEERTLRDPWEDPDEPSSL